MKSFKGTCTERRGATSLTMVLPMAQGNLPNWKKEIRMYCPCFSGNNEPFGLIEEPCKNPGNILTYKTGCPAYHLYRCLTADAEHQPSAIEFTTALLRLGAFRRSQLVAAVYEMYKGNYRQAAWSVEQVFRRIKKKKIYGTLLKDNERRLVLVAEKP